MVLHAEIQYGGRVIVATVLQEPPGAPYGPVYDLSVRVRGALGRMASSSLALDDATRQTLWDAVTEYMRRIDCGGVDHVDDRGMPLP